MFCQYPRVRAVSVTAIPTHLVADMAFGQYGQNEMLYAKTLVERIADHSLTIFDRGFLCAEILLGLSLTGEARHYLIPAKSNTKWALLPESTKAAQLAAFVRLLRVTSSETQFYVNGGAKRSHVAA